MVIILANSRIKTLAFALCVTPLMFRVAANATPQPEMQPGVASSDVIAHWADDLNKQPYMKRDKVIIHPGEVRSYSAV